MKYSLKNNSLHLLTPGQAEYFETETAARQSGYAFYFQPAFLFANISQQQLLKDLPFLQPGNQNVFNFDKKESQLLQSLFDTMIKEKDNANDNFAVLKHYLLIFLYKLKQISNKNHSNKITSKKVFGNVAITFQQLVSKHYLSITNIEQYAAMLFVTAKHLSEIVKKETGKLPKQIIHETILIEAKLLLQNTNMSIAEIASHLNFHDPSHFSNFFKAQTNVTPIAFRKEK